MTGLRLLAFGLRGWHGQWTYLTSLQSVLSIFLLRSVVRQINIPAHNKPRSTQAAGGAFRQRSSLIGGPPFAISAFSSSSPSIIRPITTSFVPPAGAGGLRAEAKCERRAAAAA